MGKLLLLNRLLITAALLVIAKSAISDANTKAEIERNRYVQEQIFKKSAERQLACLARNIYFEAANESFEGKVAVAQVTLNRVESGKFPDNVCDVVFQKTKQETNKTVCQFSWYCDIDLKYMSPRSGYDESKEVARKVLLDHYRLPYLKNALYYHADYVKPRWKLPKIIKIGHHIFYGEKRIKV